MHIPTINHLHTQQPVSPIRAAFEGLIGAGKSTFLKLMAQHYPEVILTLQEPVEEWQRYKNPKTGMNVLETYYSDPQRWAFTFQMQTLMTRSELLRKHSYYQKVLYERSVYCDYKCFASMLHDSGHIDDLEMTLYEQCYRISVQQSYGILPTHIIYLRADPETCVQRVQERNRESSGENAISLDYMTKLYDVHERVFDEKKCPFPVLTLDAQRDIRDPEVFQSMSRDILNFLQ